MTEFEMEYLLTRFDNSEPLQQRQIVVKLAEDRAALLDALILAQTHLLEALAIRVKLVGHATEGKLARTCKAVAEAINKAKGA